MTPQDLTPTMVLRVQPVMLDEAEKSKWMLVQGSPHLLFHVAFIELMILSDQHKISIVAVWKTLGLGAYNVVAPPCYKGGKLACFCYF